MDFILAVEETGEGSTRSRKAFDSVHGNQRMGSTKKQHGPGAGAHSMEISHGSWCGSGNNVVQGGVNMAHDVVQRLRSTWAKFLCDLIMGAINGISRRSRTEQGMGGWITKFVEQGSGCLNNGAIAPGQNQRDFEGIKMEFP